MRYILVIFVFIQVLYSNALPIKNQDVSPKQLEKQNKQIVKLVVEQLSKNLPQKIDNYTQFVKIKSHDTNLIYTFEINTGAKNDKTVQNEDRSRMERSVTNGVCHSSKRFLDAQISIIYNYVSAKTKAQLFQFIITQKKCYKLFKEN